MTRPSAALLVALLAVAGRASGDPDGQGRSRTALKTPDDPAFAMVLRDIQARMPALDAAAAASIQVPARAIELGPKARMYRCWRLRLTGDHGKKVVHVFERLHSIQAAMRDQKAKLTKDLLLYSGSAKPVEGLHERIRTRHLSLGSLLDSYEQLVGLGQKGKLLKISVKGLISGRRTLVPQLKEDDYTMVYDDGAADCRR